MMNIEDIKPDELVTMDEVLHKIFNAGGCNPTCHCCYNRIAVGERFKLAHVNMNRIKETDGCRYRPFRSDEPHEVMLCGNIECTPQKMVKKAKESTERHRRAGGGCSIIKGKIVP